MKSNSIYTYMLSSLILLTGCTNFLDVKPKGKLIPQEVNEFAYLLDNEDIVKYPFLNNNSNSYLSYLTDNLEISENMGKIAYKLNNSANLSNYYAYTFRLPYANPNLPDYFWDWGIYRSMKYYNNVIDGIRGLGDKGNTSEGKAVVAQAYAGRAWTYFHAAMVYGPVYDPKGENTFKTIPYVTSSDVNTPIPALSSQTEAMNLVLSDLYKALPYAPEESSTPSRAGKRATKAMLAYYHLFTQQYDSTYFYANQLWTEATAKGVDNVLYDFNELSLADPANPLVSAIKSPDNRIHLPNSREILFFRSTEERAGTANNSYPSAEFINLFDKTNDLRAKFYLLTAPGYKTTVGGVQYNDGDRIQYYRGYLAGVGSATNPKFRMTSGFTYPEVLLMRAEAAARIGKVAEAKADLALLRKYRYVRNFTAFPVANTQDEVLEQVLEERRRELPIGHLKRYLDLKRFSLELGKPWSKESITHKLGNEVFTAKVNSDHFIVPKSNPILTLHPEWNIPLETKPF